MDNLIPKNINDWQLNTINKLINLSDIESEQFDFKSTTLDCLFIHICAFANTHGGHIVLGIDENKNKQKLIGFRKNGFQLGKQDKIKNDIRNHIVKIEPTPKFQIKTIDDENKFFVVIHIQNNKSDKPYFIKDKGICYVRIGSSSTPASRTTIMNLFSDIDKQIQNLQFLRSSVIVTRESLIQSLSKFKQISTDITSVIPQLDLSLLRANIVVCESFFVEHDLLGKTSENDISKGITTILYTLDTLNVYIDGFNKHVDSEIKKQLRIKIFASNSVLRNDLQEINPFLNKVIEKIDQYIESINSG